MILPEEAEPPDCGAEAEYAVISAAGMTPAVSALIFNKYVAVCAL